MWFKAKDWNEICVRKDCKHWQPGDLLWTHSIQIGDGDLMVEAGILFRSYQTRFGWIILEIAGVATNNRLQVDPDSSWVGISL